MTTTEWLGHGLASLLHKLLIAKYRLIFAVLNAAEDGLTKLALLARDWGKPRLGCVLLRTNMAVNGRLNERALASFERQSDAIERRWPSDRMSNGWGAP